MKRSLFSAAVVLLLMLLILPSAWADTIYPAPEAVVQGEYIDHLVATVTDGGQVAATLPEGLSLSLADDGTTKQVYLRGSISAAGSYDCIISIGSTSFTCPVLVYPVKPEVSVSGNVHCYAGETATLSASATLSQGGVLSYDWYVSPGPGSDAGTLVSHDAVFQADTSHVGTFYYHCVVTNSGGGLHSSVTSQAVAVTVEELDVQSIEVVSLPVKSEYLVGDTLDPAGLSIRVNLANGSSRVLESGFGVYPTLLEKAGEQEIELSFQNALCHFTVHVQQTEEVIEGIGVLTLPGKVSYAAGETLDPKGLSIRVYTNNGYRDVSEGLDCSPETLSKAGTQTITVKYGGKSCTFTVQVSDEVRPVSLSVLKLPDKVRYAVGERLDPAGLVIRQLGSDHQSEDLTTGFYFTPEVFENVGRQEVVVSYGDLSCRFNVTVTEAAETSPSPAPTPSATPAPTPVPTPTAPASVRPTAAAAVQQNSPQILFAVILVASLLALAVLGAYVFIMNRGGFERAGETLRKFFRRGRKR